MSTAFLMYEPRPDGTVRAVTVDYQGTWAEPREVRIFDGERKGDQVLFSATPPPSLGDGLLVLFQAIQQAYPATMQDHPDFFFAFGKRFEEEFMPAMERAGLLVANQNG